jgi:GntR family transcriptional regulator
VKLQRHTATPLHKQLGAVLARHIRTGRFRPGERIPSEREICAAYGVSRTTVRQTMSDLVASGLLVRVPAKGTFVAGARIEQDLTRVVRFSEAVSAAGYQPAARLLGVRTVPAPPDAARALGLPSGERVVVADLLSLGNGVPLAFYRIHLPPEPGEATARALLAAEAEGRVTFGLVLEHVRRVAGLEPAQVVQTYEAAPASEELARLLRVAEGAALVASSRTVLTAAGVPITHDHAYYRGDRYRFTIRRAYAL